MKISSPPTNPTLLIEVRRATTISRILSHMLGIQAETITKTTETITKSGIVGSFLTAVGLGSQQSKSSKEVAKRRKTLNTSTVCKVWKATFGDTFTAKCKLCRQANLTLETRTGENAWEVSHIIPFSEGGSDEAENLRPLCRSCNRSMGGKSFKTYVEENYPDRLDELIRDFNL